MKSSHSTDDGPSCVEVAWTKSSHSTADGPDCVEVTATPTGTIHIRDSKNPDTSRCRGVLLLPLEDGPHLLVPAAGRGGLSSAPPTTSWRSPLPRSAPCAQACWRPTPTAIMPCSGWFARSGNGMPLPGSATP
ncbi:DUF397 domain-containing protein [Streptomyces sp. NBRC 110028]|uniref:DUF397 domain-containing protein n=1 Tax=Streptomyces sp. NBRC 110028 TaxID=1621260 RepID=UPI00099E5813